MNQEYMKEKPVLPLILSMSTPMMLSMLVQSLYNIIDSIFVAKIGEDALAAVSLVYQLFYYIGITSTVFSYIFNVLLDVCFVLTVYVVAKNKRLNTIKQLKVTKAPNILMAIICIATSIVCIFGFSGVTSLMGVFFYADKSS